MKRVTLEICVDECLGIEAAEKGGAQSAMAGIDRSAQMGARLPLTKVHGSCSSPAPAAENPKISEF